MDESAVHRLHEYAHHVSLQMQQLVSEWVLTPVTNYGTEGGTRILDSKQSGNIVKHAQSASALSHLHVALAAPSS